MAYLDNIDPKVWWQQYQADPKARFERITQGWGKNVISSCQYYVSGLPAVCSHWNGSECTYNTADEIPSGYSNGKCDYLGRRSWCTKYEASQSFENNIDPDWVCVAVSPDWSGLYHIEKTAAGYEHRPIKKSDLDSYCEEGGKGVGVCDGWGCGRGCFDEDIGLEELLEKPIKCKFYRPWSLGFGAIEPQTYERAIRDYSEVYQSSYEDFLENPLTSTRLPFAFEVYNMRAAFQPCAYWTGEPGTFGYVYVDGDNDYIELDLDPGEQCEKNARYAQIAVLTSWEQALTRKVWSEENTIICNGAKPECPYYTGEWKYCNDERMQHGTPITALQILELRFWTRDWGSQEEYDDFFSERPNWSDSTTPDIYTFTKWEKLDLLDTAKSIMKGIRYQMCQPSPIWNKRFEVDTYVTTDSITYPPLSVDTGTGSDEQRKYPTLIPPLWRDYQDNLRIIYPYLDKEKDKDTQPCHSRSYNYNKYNYCERRSNELSGDFTSVVGYAKWAETIYVMNVDHAEWPLGCNLYNDVNQMPERDKKEFILFMEDNIERLLTEYGDYIISTSPGAQGVFISPPYLPLDYNRINNVLILARYPNQTWQYKKRYVLPKFYGGFVVQTSFDFEPASYQSAPETLIPAAKASFNQIPIGNSVFSEIKILESYPSSPLETEQSTSYTIEIFKEEEVEVEEEDWTRIGESNYIWVEIDDLNLNYIFDWWVDSGKIVIEPEEEDEESIEIELEPVFPTGEYTSNIYMDSREEIKNEKDGDFAPSKEKLSIPPNAFILMTKDPVSLVKHKKGKLFVTYKYYKVCMGDEIGSGEERVFPSTEEWTKLSSTTAKDFTVEMVGHNISAMGFFTDEDGRDIVAFGTKLYCNINRVHCRAVELFYRYKGTGPQYQLQPSAGFADHVDPKKNKGTTSAIQIPNCGDHEITTFWRPGIGPMWFPYETCGLQDYNVWAQAAYCLESYEKQGPCLRHAGPEEYHAWCPRGRGAGGLFTCLVEWDYRSAHIENWEFTGYANIVPAVNEVRYKAEGWALPPFGNYGRDFVERYMSKDRVSYIMLNSDSTPEVKTQWMPSVIDNNSFYFSFNSFDCETTTTYDDCFSNIDQMSLFLNSTVGENIEEDIRLGWDELFEVSRVVGVYPRPYVVLDEKEYAFFYYFKNDDYIWAWQEYWKPLERAVSENRLSFLHLIKPDYYYSEFKEEIRYITDEGTHTIEFKAPKIEKGVLKNYPSISLDGKNPRYFELEYDDYDNTLIEWVDDSSGEVGGSGGEDSNIYEDTMEEEWTHPYNLIYDEEASSSEDEAEAADRMYEETTTSVDDEEETTTKYYYNRGLIAHIQKASLPFLPIKTEPSDYSVEHDVDDPSIQQEEVPGGGRTGLVTLHYNNVADLYVDFVETEGEEVEGVCIKKIEIQGIWGRYRNSDENFSEEYYYYYKPTVEMSHETISGNTKDLDYIKYESPIGDNYTSVSSLSDYTITRNYIVYPEKMLDDRTLKLNISITKPKDSIVFVKKINIYLAEYKDAEEEIYVWERKYIPSSGGVGKNVFGTEHNLKGMSDSKGPLFEFTRSPQNDSEEIGHNKVYGIFASPMDIDLSEKKELPCTKSNMREVEYEKQRELYMDNAFDKDSIGDTLNFNSVIPPFMIGFLNDKVKDNLQFNLPNMEVKSKKLRFEDHYLTNNYTFYEFWQPGGHFFEWSDTVTQKRCWLFPMPGDPRDIYQVEFNCVRHGLQNQVTTDPLRTYYHERTEYKEAFLAKNYPDTFGRPVDLVSSAQQAGTDLN